MQQNKMWKRPMGSRHKDFSFGLMEIQQNRLVQFQVSTIQKLQLVHAIKKLTMLGNQQSHGSIKHELWLPISKKEWLK